MYYSGLPCQAMMDPPSRHGQPSVQLRKRDMGMPWWTWMGILSTYLVGPIESGSTWIGHKIRPCLLMCPGKWWRQLELEWLRLKCLVTIFHSAWNVCSCGKYCTSERLCYPLIRNHAYTTQPTGTNENFLGFDSLHSLFRHLGTTAQSTMKFARWR